MSARVYILVKTVEGKTCQAEKVLRGNTNVERVEVLEGPPDIILAMGSRRRQVLAKSVLQVLTAIEDFTEGVQVLPVKKAWARSQMNERLEAI